METALIRKVLAALLLASSMAHAGDLIVNTFGGLDTQDSPAALQPYQSSDLLNVQLQPGMQSVFKRDGYGLFQSLPAILSCSTCAVHGGYHFQKTTGSDVQLWANDNQLSASTDDAAFVKIATGTVGATWQCSDNLGFAYCVDSVNDTPVKTDGSVAGTSYVPSGFPAGTMITSTPLQLVVAGVLNNGSSLYVSANNNFANFTTGPLPTDPYIEIINAPGSRITHVGYYFGKLFWWKDQSFGYISGSASQNTVSVTIVSNQIGTLDNSSAFWNPTVYETANKFSAGTNTQTPGNPLFNEMGSLGGIFFRGQDNHIYQYDGYTLTRLTRIITPSITSSNRRKSNSWAQTSASDFQAGASSPTANLSFTQSPGNIVPSSFSTTENTSAQWNNGGSYSNISVGPTSYQLSTNNSGSITNPDFESSFTGNWADVGGVSGWSQSGSVSLTCGTINPQSGAKMAKGGSFLDIIDLNGTVLNSADTSANADCTWTQYSISAQVGKRVRFRLRGSPGSLTTTDSYILGGVVTFYANTGHTSGSPSIKSGFIDNIQNGSSTITSGYFTSQTFNTGFTSSTYQLQANWTVNTSTPAFSLLTSSANPSNNWIQTLSSTGTSAIGLQYAKYTSTVSISGSDNALTTVNSVSVISIASGTYYSAIHNAPSLTAWGALGVTDTLPDNSSISYFTRSSTSSFNVNSSTPTWISQIKDTAVSASTGTWFQLKANFVITSATDSLSLNDFSFNWFEGLASDKSYITYFQDALWISESSGTATSTANRIFYLDLLNNAWLIFDIPVGGFAVENNALYFGDPTQGKIYKYGGVPADNGSAINSYWKSKDFTGLDPTVPNEFVQADFTFGAALSTATYTYTLDQKTSTAILIPTYDSASSIIRRGFLLANGKNGTFYNFQVSDNSVNPKWTLLFHRVHYNPLNWTPKKN